MKLGYCTWGMKSEEIEKVLPAVANLGYSGAELAVTPGFTTALETLDARRRAQIRTLFQSHDLALTAVAGHTSMVETDPDRGAANLQRLRDTIDLTAELALPPEPPIMASLCGGRPDDWLPMRELLAERVYALGEYAAARGVTVAVEPHTGTILDVPDKVVWLLERVAHPCVKLNFDISHLDVMGIGIDESVTALAPYAIHTHVKDERGIYPDHEFLTPGEGPFDYVHYLRAMQTAGYTGYIMVEVSMMVQRRADYDPYLHAQLAYWTMDKAFKVAGIPRTDTR